MDATPLIIAIIVVVLAFGMIVCAELTTNVNRQKRSQAHDINGALTPVMRELDRIEHGMTDDVEKARRLIYAIRNFLHPEGTATIPLVRYLRLLVSSYGEICELYNSAEPEITVEMGPLHRALINCLNNAEEARNAARSSQPIRIHVEESRVRISNPSTEADRLQLQKPSGSTRGPGRGSGRRSIQDSCDRIGWGVQWQVAGTRVVTTLSFG
jgi:hypothetical protein